MRRWIPWTVGGLVLLALLGLAGAASAEPTQPLRPDSGAIVWPLPDWPPDSVQRWQSGGRTFGALRDDGARRHAGIDLGPPKLEGSPGRAYGARVLAPVAGRVDVVSRGWSGPETGRVEIVSPTHGRIVLGAINPDDVRVAVGDQVEAGQLVATLGRYPRGSTMLHIEQFSSGPRVRWMANEPQPSTLVDPREGILAQWV